MVEFRNAFVRSVRRVRLEFSSALAVGAFVPSWFTLVCDDSTSSDPLVQAALVVPTLGNYVELVLDRDMAEGAPYSLTIAAGVPALDASTAAGVTHLFYTPAPTRAPSTGFSATDVVDLVFQEDLAHDMVTGHHLAPDGDVAVVTGPANVRATAIRGLTAEDPYWGAGLSEDVDAPAASLPSVRGKVQRQLMRDDRITGCKSTSDNLGGGDVVILAEVDLVGQLKTNVKATVNAGS